jgi:hypothetical protein
VALGLIFAGLDQALELVGVLGKPGLRAQKCFILLDQLALEDAGISARVIHELMGHASGRRGGESATGAAA